MYSSLEVRLNKPRASVDVPPSLKLRRGRQSKTQARQGTDVSQVRLDKLWARVNINLTKYGVAGVNEPMRCVRGDDHNAARFHLARFVSDRDGGAAFKSECDLDIPVRM